jgi:hypothetical protein
MGIIEETHKGNLATDSHSEIWLLLKCSSPENPDGNFGTFARVLSKFNFANRPGTKRRKDDVIADVGRGRHTSATTTDEFSLNHITNLHF